jgi:hypothetical protein
MRSGRRKESAATLVFQGKCESRRGFGSRNVDGELVYNDELTATMWALNSAVECHLHTVEVTGSNPVAPTIFSMG